MKNFLCLILIVLTSALTMSGQNSTFEIKLKSGEFTPEVLSDFEEVLELRLTERNQEYIYRIIQFYSIPTNVEKQQISKKGIELISYLPSNTFVAKIALSTTCSDIAHLNIRSLFALNYAYKMSAELTDNDLPDWAILGEDVFLNVSYYSQADDARLANAVSQDGGKVLGLLEEIKMMTIQYPASKINDLAKNPLVQWLEPVSSPSMPHSIDGLSTTRSNALNTSYGGGRKYDGTGIVVGVSDDGRVGPHIDLQGRLTQHTLDNDGRHGDMTSGIFAGAGNLDPTNKAMAPGVDINIYRISQSILLNTNTHITQAVDNFNALGTIITSTSYGAVGNSVYNTSSQFIDNQINETPFLMHVYSAGNSGTQDSGYGAGPGWATISGGFQTGKNMIAVGNLTSTDQLFFTSSRGPAEDGRIKPDLCALGDGHLTTDENFTYQVGVGTSAAAPTVAGATAQLYQAYKEHNNGTNPESGLIKASLLNTAEDLGNAGPDFLYGWGKINSLKAVRIIEDGRYINESISQGESKNHIITVPDNVSQVRIMTYWSDVGGNPAAAVNLVNDINMDVVAPDATSYNPWILDPTPDPLLLSAPAVRGVDHLNNMEQVTLDNPVAGDYTVNLNGFAIPEGPQSYFVVYDFIFDEVELTYPLGGEGFVPGEIENIKWDASISTEAFELEYSEDDGSSYTSIGTSAADTRSFAWTVPSTLSNEVKVRISRGNSISDSDTKFTIVPVPSNLNVARVCPDTIGLSWDPVPGVSMYEISMLGDKYMDSIGVSSTNSFDVTGLNPNGDQWFSVRAVVSGGKGRRAIAINKPPGTLNCILDNDLELASVLSDISILSSCRDIENEEIIVNVNNLGLQTTAPGVNVNYQIDNGAVVTEPLSMELQPGENTDFVFATNANLTGLTNGEISIWVSMPNDENVFNDTLIAPFKIFDNTLIDDFPYFEGFQNFTSCAVTTNCGLTNCILEFGWSNYMNNELDDIDWRTDSNGTASSDTGPSVDFDNGTSSGKYLYLEGSSCTSNEAILLSPCIDLTLVDEASVEFAYHMFGEDIGGLHIDLITDDGEILDIVNPILGVQGNLWETIEIDLTPYVGGIINLKIRGFTGNGPFADTAIDAFVFNASPISSVKNVHQDLASEIKIYPNPTSNDFTIQFPQQLSNQKAHIELIDVLGKRMLDIQNNTTVKNVPVDISNLANGVYLINISSKDFEVVRKLVKQ